MERSSRIELGERACRALVMENTGKPRRRMWWIVSADTSQSTAALPDQAVPTTVT